MPPTSGDSLLTLLAAEDMATFSFCESGDSCSSFLLQREWSGDKRIFLSFDTSNLDRAVIRMVLSSIDKLK